MSVEQEISKCIQFSALLHIKVVYPPKDGHQSQF